MKTNYTILLLAIVVLLFQSCSPNNQNTEANSSPDMEETATIGQSAVEDDVSQKNIVKVAVGSKDHTTLVQAVKAAQLVDALTNAGPFTVFAPTNEAFNNLPDGVLNDLLKPENKDKLSDILQYHVALSAYEEERLTDDMILNEVAGGNVTISKKDGKTMVNDATIVGAVRASNGIVYVIDKVLLPPVQ